MFRALFLTLCLLWMVGCSETVTEKETEKQTTDNQVEDSAESEEQDSELFSGQGTQPIQSDQMFKQEIQHHDLGSINKRYSDIREDYTPRRAKTGKALKEQQQRHFEALEKAKIPAGTKVNL